MKNSAKDFVFKVTLMSCLTVCIFTLGVLGYRHYKTSRKNMKIVFVSKNGNEEFVFWETMKQGAELAAKEAGIEFVCRGPKDENSAKEQCDIVESVIKERPDAMIIAPIDQEILEGPIQKAKQKGIVVVGVDSTAKSLLRVVATNNSEAGKTLMNYMSSLLNPYDTVVMLNFEAKSTSTRGREAGYKKAIETNGKLQMLPTIYTDGTTESAYEATKEILENHPEVKGVFGANQYMTEGAYLAVRDLNLIGKVKVVGFDSSDIIVEGLERTAIQAILVQKPFNMGYLAVRVAINLLNGTRASEQIDVDYKLIMKEVLYETENQKLIYPIVD